MYTSVHGRGELYVCVCVCVCVYMRVCASRIQCVALRSTKMKTMCLISIPILLCSSLIRIDIHLVYQWRCSNMKRDSAMNSKDIEKKIGGEV